MTLQLLAGFLTVGLNLLPPRDPGLIVLSGSFGLEGLLLASLPPGLSCLILIGCKFLLGLLLELLFVVLIAGSLFACLRYICAPCGSEAVTPEASRKRAMGMAGVAAWYFAAWQYLRWLVDTDRPGSAFLATLVPLTWAFDFDKSVGQQLENCPSYLPRAVQWTALALLVIAIFLPIKAFYEFQMKKRVVEPVEVC